MIPNTPNYDLKQWVDTERPIMEEFNKTNLRIDTELKSLADKNETVDATLTTLSEK